MTLTGLAIEDDEFIAQAAEDTRESLADEEYVLSADISPQRKQSFLSNYVRDRNRVATVEKLFRRASAYEQRQDWSAEHAYGFDVLVQKGPFVEGSRWLPHTTSQFAAAAERHVMRRLERLVHRTLLPEQEGAMPLLWRRVFREVDRLFDRMQQAEHTPTLVALAGELNSERLIDLFDHIQPQWSTSADLTDQWVIGTYRETPVLHFPFEADPAVYVVDMGRIARFIKYGSEPHFSIEPLDEARARDIIDRGLTAVSVPAGRPNTREERVRQLRLHVNLKLYESDLIEPQDLRAVGGLKLDVSDTFPLHTIISEVRDQQAAAVRQGWDLRRVELGTNPSAVVRASSRDGRLRVDDVDWDIVEGSSKSGIHVIAVDQQGVAHRL